MKKIYGNTKTALELTEKAAAMYAECDPLTITEHEDGRYSISGIEDRENMTAQDINEWLEELYNETHEDEEEVVVKISRINIKSETFCTPWNGKLYCVDICEDAEERSAWLYNSGYGVKTLMFGYKVADMERDEFLDVVFSNLPDYIEGYAEEYEEV